MIDSLPLLHHQSCQFLWTNRALGQVLQQVWIWGETRTLSNYMKYRISLATVQLRTPVFLQNYFHWVADSRQRALGSQKNDERPLKSLVIGVQRVEILRYQRDIWKRTHTRLQDICSWRPGICLWRNPDFFRNHKTGVFCLIASVWCSLSVRRTEKRHFHVHILHAYLCSPWQPSSAAAPPSEPLYGRRRRRKLWAAAHRRGGFSGRSGRLCERAWGQRNSRLRAHQHRLVAGRTRR